MLWIYRLLFIPVLIVSAPFYLRRMWLRGGYGENFRQRFGRGVPLGPKRDGVARVWLQAVSVGEVLAVEPLITAWAGREDMEVYLTTTTSTGHAIARDRYADKVGGIGYFPLDWWGFSVRSWRRVRPDLVILTEGERWPEHIHQAACRGVPVVAVNARLSDHSFRRMRRFRSLVRPMLRQITQVLAASPEEADRFAALGVPEERIKMTGSIKLDVAIQRLTEEEKARWRRELGLPAAGMVLMGGSTWEGEEVALLEAWRTVRASGVRCALLLVPRHMERRGEIAALLRAQKVPFHLRSEGAAPQEIEVSVADTTGEMRSLLQLADLVFVGKSLPPHTEGQTPVEAAVLGKPIIFGPGMGNFRSIARELVDVGAALTVDGPQELARFSSALLADGDRRQSMATAAESWHRRNTGAVGRTLAALDKLLQ